MEVVVVISCCHVLIKDERFLLRYIMNAIYCIILKHCDNIAIIKEEETLSAKGGLDGQGHVGHVHLHHVSYPCLGVLGGIAVHFAGIGTHGRC